MNRVSFLATRRCPRVGFETIVQVVATNHRRALLPRAYEGDPRTREGRESLAYETVVRVSLSPPLTVGSHEIEFRVRTSAQGTNSSQDLREEAYGLFLLGLHEALAGLTGGGARVLLSDAMRLRRAEEELILGSWEFAGEGNLELGAHKYEALGINLVHQRVDVGLITTSGREELTSYVQGLMWQSKVELRGELWLHLDQAALWVDDWKIPFSREQSAQLKVRNRYGDHFATCSVALRLDEESLGGIIMRVAAVGDSEGGALSPRERTSDDALPVALHLGEVTLSIRDLCNLQGGDVLEIQVPPTATCLMVIHGTVVAQGSLIAQEGGFQVRVEDIKAI